MIGDVEVWLDSVLFLGSEHRARLEPDQIATLGDRVAVYADAWSGTTEGGSFELGGLRVFELDAEGWLRALLLFDLEDRAAAFDEAFARFASGEAAGCVGLQAFAAFFRALKERALDAVRESLLPDFVMTDHRSLGLGVLDRDLYIASIQASVELSVGLSHEAFGMFAWNESGLVVAIRRFGTIPDGGGPFENTFVSLFLTAGHRVARLELFDDADVERALARFAELCAAIGA